MTHDGRSAGPARILKQVRSRTSISIVYFAAGFLSEPCLCSNETTVGQRLLGLNKYRTKRESGVHVVLICGTHHVDLAESGESEQQPTAIVVCLFRLHLRATSVFFC